jgi:predicted transcriptional regulator
MSNPAESRLYLGLGPLEYQIMDAVWTRGGWVTVGEVLDDLNGHGGRPHAYSTVKTIFAKLLRKGLLRRRVVGKAHEFAAAHGRQASERQGIHRLVQPLLNPANPLFAHLVDEIVSDDRTLAHFEMLLAQRRTAHRS